MTDLRIMSKNLEAWLLKWCVCDNCKLIQKYHVNDKCLFGPTQFEFSNDSDGNLIRDILYDQE